LACVLFIQQHTFTDGRELILINDKDKILLHNKSFRKTHRLASALSMAAKKLCDKISFMYHSHQQTDRTFLSFMCNFLPDLTNEMWHHETVDLKLTQ